MQLDHILKKLILTVRGQGQSQSDPKLVHDTPPSQDASSYKLCDSYLNQYWRCASEIIILEMRSRSRTQWPKMVCDTPPFQDAYTLRILGSYLKKCRRYAPDRIILETRSEDNVKKVMVTQKIYVTHCHPKRHPHTKFWISTTNKVRDIFRTRLF